MPRIDPLQESFITGEISPRLWGRVSLDLYKAGLSKCENFIVYPHGGITKRGGFRYVAEVKDSTKTTILQKFNYKDEFQYVFEFGHNYIRVFRNQAAVMDGAVPYEIVSTYTESEVKDLRFTQDEEKLFIVHKDHLPAELIHTDHDDWTLQNISFSNRGITTVDTIIDQGDHTNGTYTEVELENGTGSGVKATVVIASLSVESVTITTSGAIYEVDDTLTIPIATIGGTEPVTCDVATLTSDLPDAWGAVNYPTLIWFFEQRLWLAATPNEPNQVWGSRSADYFNLYLGAGLDNEGIAISIKSATKLLWAADGNAAIVLGAHNGEFKLASNSLNEALTPSNIRPVQITNYGVAGIPIIQINADMLFIQKGLRVVRRLRYEYLSNSYVAIPVNVISEHITESGVVDVAYANEPNSIFWAIRTDGVLIAMTYEPDNKVFGWHRHIIGGVDTKVQSIANVDGASNVAKDELWAVIERTINGSTVKYVEFLVSEGLSLEDNSEDAFFVDSGVTKTGSGFTVFDGLDHLEGEEVRILADGAIQAPKSVSNGEITLDIAADKAHAGLSYDASIETLPLEGGNPIGTAQAKIKRVNSLVLRLYRSLTFYMGDVFGNEDVYSFGPPEEMDSAIPLFTGDTEEQTFPGGYDTQGKIRIASYDPVPLTILAIMYELRVKD